jgi:hypothetical protein
MRARGANQRATARNSAQRRATARNGAGKSALTPPVRTPRAISPRSDKPNAGEGKKITAIRLGFPPSEDYRCTSEASFAGASTLIAATENSPFIECMRASRSAWLFAFKFRMRDRRVLNRLSEKNEKVGKWEGSQG